MSKKEEFLPAMTPSIGSNSNILFKLHRKLDDWNPIGHASVPRKLRSAMNRRNRVSTSLPLPCAKKLHQETYRNGVESPHIHGAKKKSKWNMKQRGISDQSPIITKDEEEVVEALYALAKMFPPDQPVESGLDRKTSNAYTYPLQETAEICMVTSEAPKDEDIMKSRYVSTLEAAEETVTESPLISPTVQESSIISRNSDMSLDFSVASLLCKSDNTDDTPLSNATNLGASSERFLGTGLAQTIQQKELFNEKKQHSGLWPVDSTVIKQEQQPLVKVKKEMLSNEAAAWMDSYSCVTNLNSIGNGIPTEKIQLVIQDRKKSWKKCTAHVYLSHFIQSLQNVEKKSERPVPPTQLKPNKGTICGATLTNEAVDLRRSQNGFSSVVFTTDMNGVFSFGSPNGSFARRNPDAPQLGIVQDKGLQQQQLQACTTSGIYTSEKKSCEFLSLSTRSDDLEFATTSDNCNQGENRLESLGEHRVPYHPQTTHRHQLMPCSLSHAWSSSSHSNQLKWAPAVHQLQLPQHSSNPICCPPHLGAADSQLQQKYHQQQHHHNFYHQQQMSMAQLALVSQCRSRGVTLSHFPRWQNVRPDSSTLGLCSQPILPSSSPPEGQDTKYSPGLQQQQQLLSISMASSSSSERGHHNQHLQHLRGGYYDESSVFYSEHPSNLQVLCNAKHL